MLSIKYYLDDRCGISAHPSSCPVYSPYNPSTSSTPLSLMPCRENGFKVVSEDVLSYLCTLAMQKCGKKSEKKRAACGGAAMRKRLLIKNFVAQMLQQDKPLVYFDEGLDFHYDNNLKSTSDEGDMDDSDKIYSTKAETKAEQGYCARPNKKGSLSDDSESDEEEDEVEEEEEDDGHEEVSDDEDDFDDDFHRIGDDNGSHALSMVHRQTELHYADPFYSPDDHPRSIPTTPLPSASTLCSGNSSMELWGDDAPDSYSLLSLNASQSRAFSHDPMMASQDENLFYSNAYPNPYMLSSSHGDNHQSGVTLGGYLTVDQSNVVGGGFIEDVGLCDKLDKLNDDYVSPDDEVSLANGASFTSLVNMNSPVKLGTQSFELLAYRRSITDLDTNTVVEEDDFTTCHSPSPTSTTSLHLTSRSPKKRPHSSSSFAQDDYYNLTLSSSPKRLKL